VLLELIGNFNSFKIKLDILFASKSNVWQGRTKSLCLLNTSAFQLNKCIYKVMFLMSNVNISSKQSTQCNTLHDLNIQTKSIINLNSVRPNQKLFVVKTYSHNLPISMRSLKKSKRANASRLSSLFIITLIGLNTQFLVITMLLS
jgi:hypothetical protein